MRLIVGVAGASGTELAVALLRALGEQPNCEIHLVMTDGARRTLGYECDVTAEEIASLAAYSWNIDDLAAPISSGSFRTEGMVVVPCSMKTLSGIVNGYTDNLLVRAADVCIKEKRRVVLVPREMPLGPAHLRNLNQAAGDGCVVMPPMMTFYNRPRTIQDMVDHLIGKIMMMYGLDHRGFVPWRGVREERAGAARVVRSHDGGHCLDMTSASSRAGDPEWTGASEEAFGSARRGGDTLIDAEVGRRKPRRVEEEKR